MLLTLGTVAVTAGMVDTVLLATVLTAIEAVTVMAALAVPDSAQGLLMWGGEVRIAFKVLVSKGAHDSLDGAHVSRPCMRELRR